MAVPWYTAAFVVPLFNVAFMFWSFQKALIQVRLERTCVNLSYMCGEEVSRKENSHQGDTASPPHRVSIFYSNSHLFCFHLPPLVPLYTHASISFPPLLVAFQSQSPEARAPLSGDRSSAPTMSPFGGPSAKTAPEAVSGGGGEAGAVSFVDSPQRQRIGAHGATCSNRNDDADADSVVFGSPEGARDDGSREPVARVPARSRGEVGIASEAARGRGGGRDILPRARGGDNDLYFDPVLNCYYDRAADKYYGLP